MKVRNGFVSNSSSSSFLIYGAAFSSRSEDIKKLVKKLDLEDASDTYIYELAEAIESKIGIGVFTAEDDSCLYFGRTPSSIGDDETGKEFKDKIEKALAEAFGEDIECDYLSEAWYNG